MSCDWMFIDGSSLIFRAFHGVPRTVRSPDGRPVNAVRGFLDTLARLIVTRRPTGIAVASDTDWRPAWRVELIPAYKAHRTAEPVPPDLEPQMVLIHAFLEAIGIEFIGVVDHEAEDVIASWTAMVEGTVEIVSGDRDLFALVEDPRVLVLYPEKGGLALVTEEEVTRRFGIPGRRYADYAVLRGDPSDGLPGLKGVGSVAAARYIRIHGGVAGLLADGHLSDAQRDYLERAVRVVTPVAGLAIDPPRGHRAEYPANQPLLEALGLEHGVASSAGRLVEALRGLRTA